MPPLRSHSQALSRGGLVSAARALRSERREVGAAADEQRLERAQIVGHAARHLLLGEAFGERDLDRAIEGQLARLDPLEDGDRRTEGVVIRQDRAAIAASRDLDLLGQADLFLPGQQGDLRHLAEIGADWIVARAVQTFLRLLPVGRLLEFFLVLVDRDRGAGDDFANLDPSFVEGGEQVVELFGRDVDVRQVSADLFVRQIALGLGPLNEQTEILIEQLHVLGSSMCASTSSAIGTGLNPPGRSSSFIALSRERQASGFLPGVRRSLIQLCQN